MSASLIGHNGGPALQSRWYQDEAVDSLFNFFNDPKHAHALERRNPLVCLPTGTGKSVVIARFVQRALVEYPDTRLFMSTHVKELIKQNADKMLSLWPVAPLGIYSAGLKVRDSANPIIFGGVQSCVGKFPLFGRRDLLLIDEAHLVGTDQDTSYLKFIHELQWGSKEPFKTPAEYEAALCRFNTERVNYNPYLKVIGFTATRYRLGLGCLTNGEIFTHIAYDLCTIEGFNRLMAEGYLCPLIAKPTGVKFDLTGVGIGTNGDFVQAKLQAAMDKQEITYKALQEAVALSGNRRSWLAFTTGVEHAEHVGEMLNSAFGIPTVVMHSKKSPEENEKAMRLWKSGEARCAVNMNMLTTGVDNPACDFIIDLQPTTSTGKHVQKYGRGTRPLYAPGHDLNDTSSRLAAIYHSGKLNCLCLDFAGNTARLGPINDPVIPRLKGAGPVGDAPVRICGQCNTYNHAKAKHCVVCGFEFLFEETLSAHASTLELMRNATPQVEEFAVQRVVMVPHTGLSSGKGSIKIAYYCGLRTFYEYKSVESEVTTYRAKSREWFRQRYHYSGVYTPAYLAANEVPGWDGDVPSTNAGVLSMDKELRTPRAIRVWVNTDMPKIMGYEF
jgi:DNA repair protein RadD